jgi:hypothetical protein
LDAGLLRDALFLRVVYVLVALIVSYGLVTGVVLLVVQPADDVVIRYISSFGAIFAGLLGLCTGYLIGARQNGNGA